MLKWDVVLFQRRFFYNYVRYLVATPCRAQFSWSLDLVSVRLLQFSCILPPILMILLFLEEMTIAQLMLRRLHLTHQAWQSALSVYRNRNLQKPLLIRQLQFLFLLFQYQRRLFPIPSSPHTSFFSLIAELLVLFSFPLSQTRALLLLGLHMFRENLYRCRTMYRYFQN